VHKTVDRVIANRREAIERGEGLDWATAEHLAFATLLDQGYPVRLSGQDSVRGTFVQRHSGIVDQATEEVYFPLRHLGPNQAHFEALDSALSEEAVLGFEYGFSLTDPNTLTMWEGQFGDFVNGAQVVIDQFISSGERKWLRMSGLVMLLPHGYEGQGPEHSSARLERFLQLCAEDNMQVVNCTTPANYYHALRRQMIREFRKPLVVMTPKSLLRHKRAVSSLSDLAEGSSFHRVMVDGAEAGQDVGGITLKPDDKINRVILCSGKVYFDLVEQRAKSGRDDVYILRLEQFYPWPLKSVSKELKRFKNAELIWVPGRAEEHGRLDLRRSVARAYPGRHERRRQARSLRRPAASPRPPRADEPALEGARRLPYGSLRLTPSAETERERDRGSPHRHGRHHDSCPGRVRHRATVARWTKKPVMRSRRTRSGRAGDRQGQPRGGRSRRTACCRRSQPRKARPSSRALCSARSPKARPPPLRPSPTAPSRLRNR
jgi:2-oxoglutarate dehydrogenase complex dehydrogenase (E1) component-like enzyme